jgi:hypothetical protein
MVAVPCHREAPPTASASLGLSPTSLQACCPPSFSTGVSPLVVSRSGEPPDWPLVLDMSLPQAPHPSVGLITIAFVCTSSLPHATHPCQITYLGFPGPFLSSCFLRHRLLLRWRLGLFGWGWCDDGFQLSFGSSLLC